jgi:hypothetical protein
VARLKAPLKVLGCAIALLALAGCYESSFPLDATPQADIDSRLLGGWRCMFAEPDSHSVFAMELKSLGDRRYQATTMVAGGDLGRYQVHASLVKGLPLVNVRSLQAEPDEKPWVFLRYELLKPNVLSVRAVRKEWLQGVPDSAAAVRKALEQAQDAAAVYEDVFVCLKLQ